METSTYFRVWKQILSGRFPALSIELTRECPLRCPGCYAYEPEHLHQLGELRSLADYQGQELIDAVLDLARRYQPIHISVVGGEPLVRFRELTVLLPALSEMGITVHLVTSAVREVPRAWAQIRNLHLIVSIDGLQPDHDQRRAPATYERILKNIAGHSIVVHCTVTHQMTLDSGYLERFLSFWSRRSEVKRIWFSLFTPQVGAEAEEILSPEERVKVMDELGSLRGKFSKLYLPSDVLEAYLNPPQSPRECLFARTTLSLTADLKSRITPCQLGGNPDCSQCGCFAAVGLKAVADHRLLGFLPLGSFFNASERIGRWTSKLGNNHQ